MRNIFGWDLPPGCTQRHIDEAFGGGDEACQCGHHIDDCKCPECPTCGSVGDPFCYQSHGLTYSDQQLVGQKVMKEAIQKAAEQEAAYWEAYAKECEEGRNDPPF